MKSPADWKDFQSEGRLHVFQRTLAELKAIKGGPSIHSRAVALAGAMRPSVRQPHEMSCGMQDDTQQ